MPQNYVTLQAFVSETLGGEPAVLTTKAIINQSGRALFNMRQWRFNRKGPVSVGTTASQAYADLPTDYGALIAVEGSATAPIQMVTQDEFAMLQTDSLEWPYPGYAGYMGYDDSGASPTPRLFIYPTASDTDADAFKMIYTAKWTELSGDSDIPQFPDFLEPLFLEVLQTIAQGYDEDDRAGAANRINSIRDSHLFKDAEAQDERSVGRKTQLSNGIGQYPATGRLTREQAEWGRW